MDKTLLDFYSRVYRCEDCRDIVNPRGVQHFVRGRGRPESSDYLPPTIPVSHFGDIVDSKLWVVTTNPKGDRYDPLVGLQVDEFGVNRRSQLTDSDVREIFRVQCDYFRQSVREWHPFFRTFVTLLDGIPIDDEDLSFERGDVCFVDAIKCPTAIAWGSFVRGDEGKQVWNNCLRIGNRFLPRQLELHKPRRVLYYGTGSLVKVRYKGEKVSESPVFSNGLRVKTRILALEDRLARISVELSKANLKVPETELRDIRDYISKEINSRG